MKTRTLIRKRDDGKWLIGIECGLPTFSSCEELATPIEVICQKEFTLAQIFQSFPPGDYIIVDEYVQCGTVGFWKGLTTPIPHPACRYSLKRN